MAIDVKQIIELMDQYDAKIHSQIPGGYCVRRHDDPGFELKANMEHSRFMCREIGNFCMELSQIRIDPGSAEYWRSLKKYHSLREKIMRWLGWLQRTLCFFGLYTLEECKRHLMPPGEEFKADGGVERPDSPSDYYRPSYPGC